MYPAIEPRCHGRLDVGDGHLLRWEECGAPDGSPVIVLHGGPGSGCAPGMRRFFDPSSYRIILFDQRGCGRSTPHASGIDADLSANTTWHLIADLERLRVKLGVERWLIYGVSWGSVLALAYAQLHTSRVSAMVLAAVSTGRRKETDLLTRDLGKLFPAAWSRFVEGVSGSSRQLDLADAYHSRLFDADEDVREFAARRWCEWEEAIVPTAAGPNPRYQDARFRLAFARIVTHYWRHGSWLEDGVLLRNAGSLEGIPATIVHGSLDLSNLTGTPWELAAAWPGSKLVTVEDSGHDGGAAFNDAIVAATDALRRG